MGVSINGGTPKFGWFIMEDINYNGGPIYILYLKNERWWSEGKNNMGV